MKTNRLLLAALACALLLAGCVSGPSDLDGTLSAGPQPRKASWRCDEGATLTVENLGSQIKVVTPEGTEVVLPASPPGQNARYGEGMLALVFDGREALWFVTGKTPLTCKR